MRASLGTHILASFCLAAFLAAGLSSHASTRTMIVDYNGVYGYSYPGTGPAYKGMSNELTVDVDGDGRTDDDNIAYYPFSLEDPLSPLSPVRNERLRSAVWYGGITYYFTNSRRKPTDKGSVLGPANTQDISSLCTGWGDHNAENGSTAGPDTGLRFYKLVLWKKEDFLGGGDRAKVTFDDQSLLRVHISRKFALIDSGRWVVQDGGQFFISEATFGLAGPGRWYEVCPRATRWAPYHPKPPYHIDFPSPPVPEVLENGPGTIKLDPGELWSEDRVAAFKSQFTEHDFRDVRAVGFHLGKNFWQPARENVTFAGFRAIALVDRAPGADDLLDMSDAPGGLMAAHETTYAEWRTVAHWGSQNLYTFHNYHGDMGSAGFDLGRHTPDEPVTDIGWYDALLFCNALSQMELRTPCYYTDAGCFNAFRYYKCPGDEEQQRKGGTDPASGCVYVRWDADGYRLPTAAEWSDACADHREPDASFAWIAVNSGGRTHPVGALKPNRHGLHDMAGNVWEWCWDAGPAWKGPADRPHTALGGGFTSPQPPPSAAVGPEPGSAVIGFRVFRCEPGKGGAPAAFQIPAGVPAWSPEAAPTPDGPPVPVREEALGLIKVTVPKTLVGKRATEVEVPPFYMGRAEVDFKLWRAVQNWAMRYGGYRFEWRGDMGSSGLDYGAPGADADTRARWERAYRFALQSPDKLPAYDHSGAHEGREPVTCISFFDALLWCNGLSEMLGREPVYCTDEARTEVFRAWQDGMNKSLSFEDMRQRYGKRAYDFKGRIRPTISVRWHADGFRLPQEKEWTAACCGEKGIARLLPDDPGREAWFVGDSGVRTHPVGTREPNERGFVDLFGNASEWVWEVVGSYGRRGVFGGSYRTPSTLIRLQHCQGATPDLGAWDIGLRLVRCDAGTYPEVEPPPPIKVKIDITRNPSQGVMGRGDARRSGFFPGKGPRDLARVRWAFQAGSEIHAEPIVADGMVIVGAADGHVFAVDQATGAERWRYKTAAPVSTAVACFQGKVYIGGEDRRLHILSSKNGKRLAAHDLIGEATSPAIAYGVVWIGGGRFYAFDAATGAPLAFCEDGCEGGVVLPAIWEGDVYFCWRTSVSGVDLPTLTKSAGNYVSCDGRSPAIDSEGHAYIVVGNGLWCYDMKRRDSSGSVLRLWNTRLGNNVDFGSPVNAAVGGGRVYVAHTDGRVYALQSVNGKTVWMHETGTRIETGVSLADGVLYVTTLDGRLLALDAATGSALAQFRTGSAIYSTPCIHDGVAYFGCDDGRLYAIE